MPRCSRLSESLAQFVSDGEPQTNAYAPLLRHLAICPTCREEAVRLRFIEEILTKYPRRDVDPALTERILAAIAQEEKTRERARVAEGRLLTWDIWVPAVTLVMAVSILVLSIPRQIAAFEPFLWLNPALLRQPVPMPKILPGMWIRDGDALFWALWSGFFAVAAGVGLRVSLNAWDADSSHAVTQIEGQVSGLLQRLAGRARQAN